MSTHKGVIQINLAIKGDKAMADKCMYIPNCRLKCSGRNVGELNLINQPFKNH